MKTRCYNSKSPSFKNYGARGIAICDEWKNSFEAFRDWAMANGYADNLTIDRTNNDGNYEPSNCRWVDNTEQVRNRRNTLLFSFGSENKTLKEICEILNLNYKTEHTRLKKHGYEEEQKYLTKYLELKKGKVD